MKYSLHICAFLSFTLFSSFRLSAQFMTEWNSEDNYFNTNNVELNTLMLKSDSGFLCYTVNPETYDWSSYAYVQELDVDGGLKSRQWIDFLSVYDFNKSSRYTDIKFFHNPEGEVYGFCPVDIDRCDSLVAFKLKGPSIEHVKFIDLQNNGISQVAGYTKINGIHVIAGISCENQLRALALDSNWEVLWAIDEIYGTQWDQRLDSRIDIELFNNRIVIQQVQLASDDSKVFLIDTSSRLVTEWMPGNQFVHRHTLTRTNGSVSWTMRDRNSPLIMSIHDSLNTLQSTDTLYIPPEFKEAFPLFSFDTDTSYGVLMDPVDDGSYEFLVYRWDLNGIIKNRSSYRYKKTDWYSNAGYWVTLTGSRTIDNKVYLWGGGYYFHQRERMSDVRRCDGFLMTLNEKGEFPSFEIQTLSDNFEIQVNTLKLSPNPTSNGVVQIEGLQFSKVSSTTITDLAGRTFPIDVSTRTGKIDIPEKGIFVITVYFEDGSKSYCKVVSI